MKDRVRAKAHSLGFDLCAFTSAAPPSSAPHLDEWLAEGKQGEMGWIARGAAKRANPDLILRGAKSFVVLAASYARAADAPQREGTGVVARYATHADYHDVFMGPLKELTAFIQELGGAGARSHWYVDTGPILERDFAQRAGIGFVGKHTNVVSRKLGNWFLISEIITTVEFEPDAPEPNRCGSCSRCLNACPTAALTGPFQLDARRCISYLTIELKGAIPEEFRPLLGNRIYGCDDCLAACPWNRFAREGRLMREHARDDLGEVPLVELLELDDAGFKAKFAETPMIRTKRRGVLRNVCVALGNVGGEGALPALRKAAMDHEPLIVEHALWAIGQIEARMNRTASLQPGGEPLQ